MIKIKRKKIFWWLLILSAALPLAVAGQMFYYNYKPIAGCQAPMPAPPGSCSPFNASCYCSQEIGCQWVWIGCVPRVGEAPGSTHPDKYDPNYGAKRSPGDTL